jgi:hypothetical protein
MNELPEVLKGKKGSDTFLEYSEPYLAAYIQSKGTANLEEIETVLRMPWMVWNASVLSQRPGNTDDHMASIQSMVSHFPAEIRGMIDGLKTRKETLFSQYNYNYGSSAKSVG